MKNLAYLHKLATRPFLDDDIDCLGGYTLTEIRAAATALDRGDQRPADRLVDRAPLDHEPCVAFAIIKSTDGGAR